MIIGIQPDEDDMTLMISLMSCDIFEEQPKATTPSSNNFFFSSLDNDPSDHPFMASYPQPSRSFSLLSPSIATRVSDSLGAIFKPSTPTTPRKDQIRSGPTTPRKDKIRSGYIIITSYICSNNNNNKCNKTNLN